MEEVHHLPILNQGNKTEANELIGTSQLWPSTLSLSSEAPEHVRQIYDEARLVMRKSPSSFVVQIGRAMEAVARNKNAQGRNLYERLEWLIANNFLPQIFGEMGQITRLFRNLGAHDKDIDVEPDEAEMMNEFSKAIIEYLYVAPAKLKRVLDLISQRQY